jgi:hypothetical protein
MKSINSPNEIGQVDRGGRNIQVKKKKERKRKTTGKEDVQRRNDYDDMQHACRS